MKSLTLALIIAALSLVAVFYIISINFQPHQTAPKLDSNITIRNITISVEVADDDTERVRGLSGREPLPDNHGMLFVFPARTQGSFWMKDMKFPLDIIWILNTKIIDISHEVPPPSATNGTPEVVIPNGPYTHVLEVMAGWAKKHEINIGDQVTIQL